MSRPVLYSIGFSPWSVRARMALDLAGVSYDKRDYLPTVGELALRYRIGRWRGPVTVPVLFPGDGAPITDSFDIARWASERGDRTLVPPERVDEVRGWNEVSSRALEAGRLITTRRVLQSPAALRESLPPPVRALGPLGMALGRSTARGLLTKYGEPGLDEAGCRAQLTAALDATRAGLSGRDHLLGAFSYADLTIAAGLAFVKPHESTRIGKESRRLWTDDALADAYADLLDWRDQVFARWRARGSGVQDPVQ